MAIDPRGRAPVYGLLPGSALARAGLALLGLSLFVLAFFFVVVAVIVGGVAATVALVRWWWLSRKLASSRGDGALEGEYVIVERTTRLEEPRDR